MTSQVKSDACWNLLMKRMNTIVKHSPYLFSRDTYRNMKCCCNYTPLFKYQYLEKILN
jgi:hypothetical protein